MIIISFILGVVVGVVLSIPGVFEFIFGTIISILEFLFCCFWHPIRFLFNPVTNERYSKFFDGQEKKIHLVKNIYLVIDKKAVYIYNKIFFIRFIKNS